MYKSQNHSKYSLIHLLIDYDVKVSVLQLVRRLKQEITFKLWKVYEAYLKNIFGKNKHFGQIDTSLAAQVREQVMIQSKSTLEAKVNSDSSHRLKTNGLNRLKK